MSPSEILPAVKDLLSRRDEHLGRQGDAPELRGKQAPPAWLARRLSWTTPMRAGSGRRDACLAPA
jgi:hypothetical protein